MYTEDRGCVPSSSSNEGRQEIEKQVSEHIGRDLDDVAVSLLKNKIAVESLHISQTLPNKKVIEFSFFIVDGKRVTIKIEG
ncbi:hypothetical protein MOD91_18405 [Bacillus haynesii]|uniref:hypothetical protein n=1 Tax=Bacillus haynesii TaxID=1925021 RepID=UPI00227FE0DA|nr:hypothetical protein [Bacillus haynesii]MCY8048418.1 hypothetical protein [Bacillus haynesii]MCY8668834.1 hypothetical protein [Bacillus haynesii]MCY9324027.1 hypothetical protein [Bacillus haynesii]